MGHSTSYRHLLLSLATVRVSPVLRSRQPHELGIDLETPEETKNLVALGRMVAAAALLREESRGAHFRTDFPATAPTARRQHVLYRPDGVLPVTLLDEPASREIARREIA